MSATAFCARQIAFSAALAASWAHLVIASPMSGGQAHSGPPSTCLVGALDPVDPAVTEFEKHPNAHPTTALRDIDVALRESLDRFVDAMTRRGIRVTQTSGYRPTAYQAHLYDVAQKWKALAERYEKDVSQKAACAALQARVDDEINKHRLKRLPSDVRKGGRLSARKGQPLVNPPGKSTHEVRPRALAVDVSTTPWSPVVARRALALGLAQPCSKDIVHFSSPKTGCEYAAEITMHSPARLFVIDPRGRAIGYSATAGGPINEIGDGAHYSDLKDGLESVSIAGVLPGLYEIGGTGTEEGDYTVSFIVFGEAGALRVATAWGGTARPGIEMQTRRVRLFPPERTIRTVASAQTPVPPVIGSSALQPETGTPPPAVPTVSTPTKRNSRPSRLLVAVVPAGLVVAAVVILVSRRRPRGRDEDR